VIVFDTVNLTWRQTQIDWLALSALMGYSIVGPPEEERRLIREKTSIIMENLRDSVAAVPEASIPLKDVLYKDFKVYEDKNGRLYGIAVVRVPLEHYANEDYSEIVFDFMRAQSVYLLAIFTPLAVEDSSDFIQHLILFVDPSIISLDCVYSTLQDNNLQLRPLGHPQADGNTWEAYLQGNNSISRKQLHPILRALLGTPQSQ
jgi:hypothetical protein